MLFLPNFVSKNLKIENENPSRIYQQIIVEYENHVKELEMIESFIKDEIGMINSAITTEMSRTSIKESKRVMLCMFTMVKRQSTIAN